MGLDPASEETREWVIDLALEDAEAALHRERRGEAPRRDADTISAELKRCVQARAVVSPSPVDAGGCARCGDSQRVTDPELVGKVRPGADWMPCPVCVPLENAEIEAAIEAIPAERVPDELRRHQIAGRAVKAAREVRISLVAAPPVGHDPEADRLLRNCYETLTQVYWAASNGKVRVEDMKAVLDRHRPLLRALTDRVVDDVRRPEMGDRGVLERIREQAALEADDTPNGLVFSSIANEAERALSVSPSPVDAEATVERVAIWLAGGDEDHWRERAEVRDEGGKAEYRIRAREFLAFVWGAAAPRGYVALLHDRTRHAMGLMGSMIACGEPMSLVAEREIKEGFESQAILAVSTDLMEALKRSLQASPFNPTTGGTTMHPAVEEILRHFEFAHLPEELQAISGRFCDMAHSMVALIGPDGGAELTVGLRKLLEAKDCMVRAKVVAA